MTFVIYNKWQGVIDPDTEHIIQSSYRDNIQTQIE